MFQGILAVTRWLTAPGRRQFVAFFSVVGIAVLIAAIYSGRLNRRQLLRTATQARHLLRSETELNQLRGEKTALEFQRANLAQFHPYSTNAASAETWNAAILTAALDPEVRQALRAYQREASPRVLASDSSLEAFCALQEGYETAVDRLLAAPSPESPAHLAHLRTNTFASLFTHPAYLEDRARFDRIAREITEPTAIAARSNYFHSLTMRLPTLNPALSHYARELQRSEAKWAALQSRLAEIDLQLGESVRTAPSAGRAEFGRELLALCWPRETDYWTIEALAAGFFLLLTFPSELRHHRWRKIGASLGLIYLALLAMRVPMTLSLAEKGENVFAFFGFVMPMVVVAALWTGDVAWYLAHGFTTLVDSSGPAESESASLRPALAAAQQGEYRAALRLLDRANRGRDYESQLLRARLQRRLNRKWRTRLVLKELLRANGLHPSQRSVVQNLLDHLDQPTHPAWDISGGPPPVV